MRHTARPPASTSRLHLRIRLRLPPPPPASTSRLHKSTSTSASAAVFRVLYYPLVWPLSVLALCAAGGVLAKETRGRRTLCRPNEHPWHPKWVFHQRVLAGLGPGVSYCMVEPSLRRDTTLVYTPAAAPYPRCPCRVLPPDLPLRTLVLFSCSLF